ncbi:MAG TPA: hypothetical protein VNK04_07275 [Gemmataceae bacterium]|nr:hypothetical protein [Gemmataceae bacterium]
MNLRFRYKLVRAGRLIPSLGGRTVRPRPLVDVTVIGPIGSRVRPALLDTAADDTILPESLAVLIGVDLSTAPTGSATSPITGSIPLRYAPVTLRLTDGREQREWPATVAFTPARLIHPLLGFAGCLQYFTATFMGDREEVELAVNALYPGT